MNKTYVLCGRPGACCPEVEYNNVDETVSVTDDDGDIITMTREQFRILKETEYSFL